MKGASNRGKIFLSILSGMLVGAVAASTHWFVVAHDRILLTHAFLGDLIGGLVTAIMCLAIELWHEWAYFVGTMYSVSIVSQLNHQLRSAIFPLCLAVQRTSDQEPSQLTDQAVERINAALREATAIAISGRGGNAPRSK